MATDTLIQRRSLRRRAEDRLESQPRKVLTDNLPKLVHELQVHQVELEIQNEELLRTKTEVEALLEKITDLYDFSPVGYLTLDRVGNVLEANQTSCGFLRTELHTLIGQRLSSYMTISDRHDLSNFLGRVFLCRGKEACEVVLTKENSPPQYVQLEAVAKKGENQCRLAIIDVNDRIVVELEKEKLIKELQTTLEEIKTLKGIIPICMHCKEIRDDKGAWKKLEEYIMERSEAEFSHGICDKCMAEVHGRLKK